MGTACPTISPTSFTTSFKLIAAPQATLKTPPETPGADPAARFASTVLSMKQKSRDCVPSP